MRNKKNNHGLQNSSLKFWILLAITAVLVLKTSAQTPTLGTYSNSTAAVGANTTVTPSATPTGATRINVSTNSNSKGVLTANTTTGMVRVTNAQSNASGFHWIGVARISSGRNGPALCGIVQAA